MIAGTTNSGWTRTGSLLQSSRPVKGNLLQVRTLKTYVIVAPLLIAAHVASACAEIRVEGSASSVHVDARDATVADVIAALAERFSLRVRGAVGDRRISADFDGSLRQVIARVLDGYNYVMQTRGDGHRADGAERGIITRGAAPDIRAADVSGCQTSAR